jgi:hypothetical protein
MPPKGASKVIVTLPHPLTPSKVIVDCYKRVFVAVSELEVSLYG